MCGLCFKTKGKVAKETELDDGETDFSSNEESSSTDQDKEELVRPETDEKAMEE